MARSYNQKRKNNIIIGTLCAVVVLMSVGYAVFNTVLDISGTSSIKSTWNIHFDTTLKSETEVDNLIVDGKQVITTEAGLENATKPKGSVTYDGDLTANLTANLIQPGDEVTYNLVVKNDGDLPAKLTSIEVSDPDNEYIVFTNSTQEGFTTTETNLIKVGETLESKVSKNIVVRVAYKDVTLNKAEPSNSNFTVQLNFEQDGGNNSGTTPGGDGKTPSDLTNNVVTTGDGLYEDSTEAGRYIYKGAKPNNYITFNNETWRILSIESDGTLKILKEDVLSNNLNFDTNDGRYESGTYCSWDSDGCNVWGSRTTMLDNTGANITTMAYKISDGTKYTLPTAESTLNTYLNTTYYNSLDETTKELIYKDENGKGHLWNVGIVSNENGQTLATDIQQEKANKWKGKVGLISPSDYVKASTNTSCKSIYIAASDNSSPCKNNNYIYKSGYPWWTMVPYSGVSSYGVWSILPTGQLFVAYACNTIFIRPALYLDSNITLSGEGTQLEPYTIVS